jgi:MFS family permease
VDSQLIAIGSGRVTGKSAKPAGLAQGIVLVSVSWLAVVAAGVLAPVLPKMTDHFAGARMLGLMIGLVATIPSLAVALFSIPIGKMSDRTGARRILVIGMSGYGLAGLLPLWLDSLPAIVASRFVVGFFEAAVMTGSTTLISLCFSGIARDRWLAVQVASTNVMGVVVVVAGGLAGEHGWRMPFFAYAIALVLLVPVLAITREPGRNAGPQAASAPVADVRDWWIPVAIRCALTFFVSVTVYALIVQMAFLFAERGVVRPSEIGFGIAFGAGGLALGAVANTLLVSISPLSRLAACYGFMAAGLGLLAVDPAFATMCAGALAAGLGSGCAVSTLLCFTVAAVPDALKGRATGAWTAALFGGQFLNPPIFLALVFVGGSYAQAFLIYSGLCLAIVIGAALHIARARRRLSTTSVEQQS